MLVAVPAGIALTGCSPSGESDETEIRELIDTAFTRFVPSDCTELLTDRVLEQVDFSDSDDEDPVENCQEDAEEDPGNADSVSISDLEIEGDRSTATVAPKGGDFDGAAVDLEFVDADGWRIDWIAGLEIMDRGRFLDAVFAGGFRTASELADDQRRCIEEYLRAQVSTGELERIYPEGNISFVYDAMRECLGDGSDRRAITGLFREGLLNTGLSVAQAECVLDRLRRQLRGIRLENAEEVFASPEFQVAAQAAGARCVAGRPAAPPAET